MPLIRRDPSSPRPGDSFREEGRPEPTDPLAGLADPDPDRRWQAARDATDRPGAAAALLAALANETDRRVREAMLANLARGTGEQGVAALVGQVRSEDAAMRMAALDALRDNPGGLASHLPVLLRDADPDMRLLICEVAREMPAAVATPLLVELLDHDPSANVCCAAIEVLAEIGDSGALPALTRCAGRFATEPFVAFSARAAAARIGATA